MVSARNCLINCALVVCLFFQQSQAKAWFIQPPESDFRSNDARAASVAMMKSFEELLGRFAGAEADERPVDLPQESTIRGLAETFGSIASSATRDLTYSPEEATFATNQASMLGVSVPATTAAAYILIQRELSRLADTIRELRDGSFGPNNSRSLRHRELVGALFQQIARTVRVGNMVSVLLQSDGNTQR